MSTTPVKISRQVSLLGAHLFTLVNGAEDYIDELQFGGNISCENFSLDALQQIAKGVLEKKSAAASLQACNNFVSVVIIIVVVVVVTRGLRLDTSLIKKFVIGTSFV